MNHTLFYRQLSAYVDGELSDDESVRLTTHMEACSICRTRLDDLRRVGKEIRDAASLELPGSFPAQIMRTIRTRLPQAESWQGAEQLAWRVVLALTVLVLCVMALGNFQDSEQTIIVERYLTGTQTDSVVQSVLSKADELSKDDVLLAAVTR